ncbi:unnamed protein product [Chrysoparadoxa australica]
MPPPPSGQPQALQASQRNHSQKPPQAARYPYQVPTQGEYPVQQQPQQQQQQYQYQGRYSQQQQQQQPGPEDMINPNQVPHESEGSGRVLWRTCTPVKAGSYPSATSNFIAIDEGNASPRFMRPTLRYVPQGHEFLKLTGMPLALEITPLATLHAEEEPVPLIDFGPGGPPRCKGCHCYLNPHAYFVDDGDNWICNLCGQKNQVQEHYRCRLDGAGLRKDRGQRVELCRGSVDFAVPAAYSIRPLQEPIYVFLIDVSPSSRESGFAAACLAAISEALDMLPGGERARAGVVTFDSTVHFYPRRGGGSEDVEMVVAADIDNPGAPVPPHLWVPPVTSNHEWFATLLERIPTITNAAKGGVASQLGVALGCVVNGLKALGGRVLVMSQVAPFVTRSGAGALPCDREKIEAYGTDAEHKMYQPAKEEVYYTKLAQLCAASQIGVDMLVSNQQSRGGGGGCRFCDIATLGQLPRATGGRLAYLTDDVSQEESQRQIGRQLVMWATEQRPHDCVLKVRCSKGLTAPGDKHYHVGIQKVPGEVEFAALGKDRCISVELEYSGGRLPDNGVAYAQAALLYTSAGTYCNRILQLSAIVCTSDKPHKSAPARILLQ